MYKELEHELKRGLCCNALFGKTLMNMALSDGWHGNQEVQNLF